jgi:hypothetical protein
MLINSDPWIADDVDSWSECMNDQDHDFDSELAARSHFANSIFNLTPDAAAGPDLAAAKAAEAEVATAAWDCSGGEDGASLRENVRRRVLADFVVMNREDLDVELDIALLGACDAVDGMMSNDKSADFQEVGEARLQSIRCGEVDSVPDFIGPPD